MPAPSSRPLARCRYYRPAKVHPAGSARQGASTGALLLAAAVSAARSRDIRAKQVRLAESPKRTPGLRGPHPGLFEKPADPGGRQGRRFPAEPEPVPGRARRLRQSARRPWPRWQESSSDCGAAGAGKAQQSVPANNRVIRCRPSPLQGAGTSGNAFRARREVPGDRAPGRGARSGARFCPAPRRRR